MEPIDSTDFSEKYQALLKENLELKAEIAKLKSQLNISIPANHDDQEIIGNKPDSPISKNSSAEEKIKLFLSLFRGRTDVYAKRWQNKKGKSGYSPVCLNEWKSGICVKPNIKCSDCSYASYGILDEKIIEEHLKGNLIVGLYPMLRDETCCFLAIDFDEDGWQDDISVLRNICNQFNIPAAVERSRSGNGAHVWFFFESPIPAVTARRFGTSLLTYSMNHRHQIKFKSYDRFFPNQDTMSKGGFGNLIALPLQKAARKNENTLFIDENFKAYSDQWEFLCSIKKLSDENIKSFISRLCNGDELGILKQEASDEEFSESERISNKPWETKRLNLGKDDFPKKINVVKANMLYILKEGISQRALNSIQRLAAFQNPEFYKAQAMRLPTYNKPRIIFSSEETNEYLGLPRGSEDDLNNLLDKFNVDSESSDKTNPGTNINVEFTGRLKEEQLSAINELIKFDNGVLSAATAFGKTVVAAALIAERKVNTLILVHRKQLLLQWIERLSEFLNINEKFPSVKKKGSRKKGEKLIGQIGGGKENLNGIIDIAIMQSLYNKGEVKELVKNYGMVIVDECHHVPAFSFEQILKNVNAKYVYGLTATPTRKDGHHPIIFMFCGPKRFIVDAKKQAELRPFEHYLIPRFTGFKIPFEKEDNNLSIQDYYSEIVMDELRNQLIVDDVVSNYERGRNSLVLTERTAHVGILGKMLHEKMPYLITLIGTMKTKETKEALSNITNFSPNEPLTIISTGKFIGEGFDESRLDTLFLAMPISWKGTIQQYAGRLHRLHESKDEVLIFDYVDIHVRMFEKMYQKRLRGYAAIGYKARGESVASETSDIIFDRINFFPVYSNDVQTSVSEILIVSPFVTKRRVTQMLQILTEAVNRRVKVTVVTRPLEDFANPSVEINSGKTTSRSKSTVFKSIIDSLNNAGVDIIFKSKIHQKFAVIDQKLVWYGSINLLSFGSSEESILRIVSSNIAQELKRSIL